jgi:hypothetical protein
LSRGIVELERYVLPACFLSLAAAAPIRIKQQALPREGLSGSKLRQRSTSSKYLFSGN